MMRSTTLALWLLLAAGTTAWAEPARDASVRELLVITEAEKLVGSVYDQLDGVMRAGMRQALGDTRMTPAQQQIVDDAQAEMLALFKREMSWIILEPRMMEIYRVNFSEAEVQGMLQFYKSEVGQAVIAKMPVVMQSSMQIAQQQMGSVLPGLREIQEKMATRLQALCPDGTEPGSAGCKSGT